MGDDFMKSALDRAMERADGIEIPEEKLREMKHRPEGERVAAEFIKEAQYDLKAVLESLDAEARPYVVKIVESILLQNVVLPKKESDTAGNEKAFEGLSTLKKGKDAVKQAQEQLGNLSNYYTQARKQHYDQLKAQVEQMMAQAVQQQTGSSAAANINVEQTPEFQENWRQISGKLDADYDQALAQLKEQIVAIQ
ncbi:MAG: hypothetical protein HOC20_06750 [Chloroflexi bacterium]|jgi:hypothetical protein|nr:hypothetical protein [Chloroflexota bacterium]